MTSLVSLDTHNRERSKEYDKLNGRSPVRNGIACPKCHRELVDSAPDKLLMSDPPKKNVSCPICGYVGYRVA